MNRVSLKKLAREIFAVVFAVVLAASTGLSAAVNVSADETGIATGEDGSDQYLDPPATVKWLDESNLILGFSKVEGADGYDLELYDKSGNYVMGWGFPQSSLSTVKDNNIDLYKVDVNKLYQHAESYSGEKIEGKITVKVYAKTKYSCDIRNAKCKEIQGTYVSRFDQMTYLPTPTNVALKLDENNKLVITFNFDGAIINNNDLDFKIIFSTTGPEEDDVGYGYDDWCVPAHNSPQFLRYTIDGNSVTVSVSDSYRENTIEKYLNELKQGSNLTVSISARISYRLEDEIIYKASKMSDSATLTNYQMVNPVSADVNSYGKNGTAEVKISSDETKKLISDAETDSTLKLTVTKPASSEDGNKEFNESKKYASVSKFEVKLNQVNSQGKATPVTETNRELKITIPVPEEMQGKKIIILRKHDGKVQVLASEISSDGKTVTFYTDKFSDYAIAVQDDSSQPTAEPTATPTVTPTAEPTATPSTTPTTEPTATPSATPTVKPTTKPDSGNTGGSAAPAGKNTVTADANGTVKTSNASPKAGDTVTLTAEPKAGYTVSTVSVADSEKKAVKVTANEDGTFSFKQPENGAAVNVTFAKAVQSYRVYNPNTGEHVYTLDENEKNSLVKAGWKDEAFAWTTPEKSGTPIYRVYNPNAGDHHYTTNKAEVDMLVKAGWKNEGVAMYSSPSNKVKVYRLYNPNQYAHNHHYTVSKAEKDQLIKYGWKDEGVGWLAAE